MKVAKCWRCGGSCQSCFFTEDCKDYNSEQSEGLGFPVETIGSDEYTPDMEGWVVEE